MNRQKIIIDSLREPSPENFVNLILCFRMSDYLAAMTNDANFLRRVARAYKLSPPLDRQPDPRIQWKELVREYAYKNPGAIVYNKVTNRAIAYLDTFHGHGRFLAQAKTCGVLFSFLTNAELSHFRKYELIKLIISLNIFNLADTEDHINLFMYFAMLAEMLNDVSLLNLVPPRIMLRVTTRLKTKFLADFIQIKIENHIKDLSHYDAINYYVKTACFIINEGFDYLAHIIVINFANYMHNLGLFTMSSDFIPIYVTARRYYDTFLLNFIEEHVFGAELSQLSFFPGYTIESHVEANSTRTNLLNQINITRHYITTGSIQYAHPNNSVKNMRVDYVDASHSDIDHSNIIESSYSRLIWIMKHEAYSAVHQVRQIDNWQENIAILTIIGRYADVDTLEQFIDELYPNSAKFIYLVTRVIIYHPVDSPARTLLFNFDPIKAAHAAYTIGLYSLAHTIICQRETFKIKNHHYDNYRCRYYAIKYNDLSVYRCLVDLFQNIPPDVNEDLVMAASLGRHDFYIFIQRLPDIEIKLNPSLLSRIVKDNGFHDLTKALNQLSTG